MPASGSLDAQSLREVLTVSQLNGLASAALQERFTLVWVAGEVSNFARPASGHWYFTLKDASASVRAVMFRTAARAVRFDPREGDRIEVLARVSIYEARGDFQLGVERMRPAGAGDLYQRFLRLKQLLQDEGLFDSARKRPLPSSPRAIGVISSPQAAALRDVLTTLRRRAPHLPVIIYPASVQGVAAPAELLAALAAANRRDECDVLLLVRGGGSIEDLNAFNDEQLARAVAASRLPVVSGVGHETDFTISDFVADARAPTPTAAAVLVSRDRSDVLEQLRHVAERLQRAMRSNAERSEQRLDLAARLLRSPSTQLRERIDRLARAASGLSQGMRQDLQRRQARVVLAQRSVRPPQLDLPSQRLEGLRGTLCRTQQRRLEQAQTEVANRAGALAALNPKAVVDRGYAIVRNRKGEVVRDPEELTPSEALDIEMAGGVVQVRVETGT